jgi:hypothetical protein
MIPNITTFDMVLFRVEVLPILCPSEELESLARPTTSYDATDELFEQCSRLNATLVEVCARAKAAYPIVISDSGRGRRRC